MADLSCSRTNRISSSFATKHFQRKLLKIFDLHPPLRLVSFMAQIITWKARCWVTDTQTKYYNPRCAKDNCSSVNACHCPILSSPCPVGQGLPQLPGGAQPLCSGRWSWQFLVLYNHPVWKKWVIITTWDSEKASFLIMVHLILS